MNKLKKSLVCVAILAVAGCAELNEINQQLADWAGEQIKKRDANKLETSDTLVSKRNIDTLYVRVKRAFNFQTIDEALDGCSVQSNMTCRWTEAAIREGGYIHERTPGVYYRMGRTVSNPNNNQEPFYVEVTLEKEDKTTLISYKTRGSQAWADEVKSRLTNAVK